MYFPYFRGRQYELLALKELVNGNLLSDYVIPVVEPVKLTSTFDGTFLAFDSNKKNIALIFNPAVGEFAEREDFVENYYCRFDKVPSVLPTVLLNKNTKKTLDLLTAKGIDAGNIVAILDKRDYLENYKKLFGVNSPKYTLFPDERQMRRTVTNGKIMFDDKFCKQSRNSDYPEDEFFSDDHLYFKSEGYSGFGDYSIIGNEYAEGGFAPYAVAIHIVYFAEDKTLQIKHFVSDSNEDISDIAGKFNEAISKLEKWYDNKQDWQRTSAISTLLDFSKLGYYPGLPTVKKLSIMHHLELVGKYLEGAL